MIQKLGTGQSKYSNIFEYEIQKVWIVKWKVNKGRMGVRKNTARKEWRSFYQPEVSIQDESLLQLGDLFPPEPRGKPLVGDFRESARPVDRSRTPARSWLPALSFLSSLSLSSSLRHPNNSDRVNNHYSCFKLKAPWVTLYITELPNLKTQPMTPQQECNRPIS